MVNQPVAGPGQVVSDRGVFMGLLVHSTVDFNLQIPANALTMVVILAMGWVAHALPSPGAGRRSIKEAVS